MAMRALSPLSWPSRVAGHEPADVVVVLGRVRARRRGIDAEDAEAVADRDAGGDEEEVVGEPGVVPVLLPVEVVVEDEGAHDDGLPRPRRHLERDAGEVERLVVALTRLGGPELGEHVLPGVRPGRRPR